jgi:hypothetical protein
MVGKWYKYIGPTDKYFTTNKWYLCYELGEKGNLHFIDNSNDKENLNWFSLEGIEENIDLSNPKDQNPDEVKEEKKPEKRCDTITIVIFPDGEAIMSSHLTRFECIEALKSILESEIKKINEGN